MSDFNINHITGKQGQQGIVLAGITTVNSTGSMGIPSGPTWNRGGRGRGIFGGGNPSNNVLNYITIASTGNASDFGDLTVARITAAVSSTTRGVFAGGAPSPATIDYVTISSKGGASDFGTLVTGRNNSGACSSSTRGVYGGGSTPAPAQTDIIDYVTIASTGSSSDFGDMLTTGSNGRGGMSDGTRGIFCGFQPPAANNVISYITIATKGDAQDFGDMTIPKYNTFSLSNSTRGCTAAGVTDPAWNSWTNVIDYVTIATKGNATNFGDVVTARRSLGGCSSSTRGVWAGGYDQPAYHNIIEYVTIASTGDTTDFGDLTTTRESFGGCSDVHGGLGD